MGIGEKTIVISAVNFTEGGPLTILRQAVASCRSSFDATWRVVVLVHQEGLVETPGVEYLTFESCKRSWRRRLQAEWFQFNRLSATLKPDLWLSLHDVTPRVQAKRQAVYCHNPSPFYSLKWRDVCFDPRFAFFNLFYRYVYGLFLKRNHNVVVQQAWLREEFRKIYGHPAIVVAHPSVSPTWPAQDGLLKEAVAKTVIFYPSLPRVFKNMEVLCEAATRLRPDYRGKFEIRLTLDGRENKYARWLLSKYGNTPGLKFIGRQNQEQMTRQYRECSAVFFPSKLETWGLPITEAKAHSKPLFVADLPYARETVGDYKHVAFLPPGESIAWQGALESLIDKQAQYTGNFFCRPETPFAEDWSQLWRILSHGL